MKRREFITLLGGAAVWPLTARGQQSERYISVLMTSASPQRADFGRAGSLTGDVVRARRFR